MSTETRLDRLQRQVELVCGRGRRAVPDAVTVMRTSGFEPDPWQVQAMAADDPRLIILASRQSGKSLTMASLAVATILAGPVVVLCVSPALRQSQELYRKVRQLYRPYAAGVPVMGQSALQMELANGGRVISLPGTSDTVRSYTADVVLVDEAARVEPELFAALSPMTAVTRGRLIMASTPAGKRGHFYETWSGGEGWHHLHATADDCPRLDPAFLAQERRDLGESVFLSEYYGVFSEATFAAFREHDLQAMLDPDLDPNFAGWCTPYASEVS